MDKAECFYCQREFKYAYNGQRLKKTVDHIVPKCRGGNNQPINKVISCSDCNSLKGEYLPIELYEAIDGMVGIIITLVGLKSIIKKNLLKADKIVRDSEQSMRYK